MINSKSIGNEAERIGSEFLKKKGYKILNMNFRTSYGEIDIIAKNESDLVFVEVKFRKSSEFGHPKEAVGKHKQKRIVKAAIQYLKEEKLTKNNIRFDVLSIGPSFNEIELVKSAFDAPSSYNY
ncbi:YraN family protein [Elusimicrobiota bacterium]